MKTFENFFIFRSKGLMKKVVVISGASSGIGFETANFLTERGYVVYGLSRRDFETEKFNFIKCDVCN